MVTEVTVHWRARSRSPARVRPATRAAEIAEAARRRPRDRESEYRSYSGAGLGWDSSDEDWDDFKKNGWDSSDEEFVDELVRVRGPDSSVAKWRRRQQGGEVGPPPVETPEAVQVCSAMGRSPPWDSSDDECIDAMAQALGPPMFHAKKKPVMMVSPAAFMEERRAEDAFMEQRRAFMEQRRAEGDNNGGDAVIASPEGYEKGGDHITSHGDGYGGDDEGDGSDHHYSWEGDYEGAGMAVTARNFQQGPHFIISGNDGGGDAIISDAVGDDGGGAFAGAEGDGNYGRDDGVDTSIDTEGNNNGATDGGTVLLYCECCSELAYIRRADVTGDPEDDDKLFCMSCWTVLQMWHPRARGWLLQQGAEMIEEERQEQHNKKRLLRRTVGHDGYEETSQQEKKQQQTDGNVGTMFGQKGNPRCVMKDECVGYDQDDVVKAQYRGTKLELGTIYCIPCWRRVRQKHDTTKWMATLQERTS